MLRPLSDKVLVKLIKKDDKSKGGIILTEEAKEKTLYAYVVEVGEGTEKSKIQVKKGQKIILNEYSGTKIDYQNEEYFIVEQKDILAIIEE